MRGHNICYNGEILKIIPKLSLLLLLIWSPDMLNGRQGKVIIRVLLRISVLSKKGKQKSTKKEKKKNSLVFLSRIRLMG